MKAVLQLLWSYFFGISRARWLTATGLLLILGSIWIVLYLPQTEHMLALAWPGIILVFVGTSRMPLTVAVLSGSRHACILPGARIKLLASVVLTVLLVALPAGLLTPLAYVAGMSATARDLFAQPGLFDYTLWLALFIYTSACIAAAWIYVLVWVTTRERNSAGFAKALLVALLIMLLPRLGGEDPEARLHSNFLQLGILLAVFSTLFLIWPRLPRLSTRWGRPRPEPVHTSAGDTQRALPSREIDLLLGNARPWLLAGALLLQCVAMLGLGMGHAGLWSYYVAIIALVAGGNAERAPARSRALWLRSEQSRAALFAAVERSTWRHNGMVMLSLLAIFLAAGSYVELPGIQMLLGVPLILVGTALSTYLGLSLTRGIRIGESLLAIAATAALMTLAALLAEHQPLGWALFLLGVLAAMALGLRGLAQHRWRRIDWSECRRDPFGKARPA